MIKRTRSLITLSISSNIRDLISIRQSQDPDFVISHLIEDFLRDFFAEDLKNGDLEKKKLEQRKREIQKEMALIKAQEQEIERVKEEEKNEWYRKQGIDPKKVERIYLPGE